MLNNELLQIDGQEITKSFQRLEMIRLAKPRCPRCGGARLKKYRSISDQGDGSSLSWVRCQAQSCGRRFKVLLA